MLARRYRNQRLTQRVPAESISTHSAGSTPSQPCGEGGKREVAAQRLSFEVVERDRQSLPPAPRRVPAKELPVSREMPAVAADARSTEAHAGDPMPVVPKACVGRVAVRRSPAPMACVLKEMRRGLHTWASSRLSGSRVGPETVRARDQTVSECVTQMCPSTNTFRAGGTASVGRR